MSAASAGELLGAQGPFSQRLPGFLPRAPQQEMADAVEQTLAERSALVVEAGTGTGKTYAYLTPALMSGGRVIVSTGTKNLQDQLFFRDLPRVRDTLASPARISLLKGRGNYLCIYRLRKAQLDPRGRVR
ncbi:MAG TPA: DEAD/DEAH box helicase, partial [Nevskia sp.]|nr:DEAD/DEAH box helicase [Nevskia sp.]